MILEAIKKKVVDSMLLNVQPFQVVASKIHPFTGKDILQRFYSLLSY